MSVMELFPLVVLPSQPDVREHRSRVGQFWGDPQLPALRQQGQLEQVRSS